MAGDIREDIEAIKKEVRELRALGADKVLVVTVEDIEARLSAVERFIRNKHVTSEADQGAQEAGDSAL